MNLYRICFYHNSDKMKINKGSYILNYEQAISWIKHLNKKYQNITHYFESQNILV